MLIVGCSAFSDTQVDPGGVNPVLWVAVPLQTHRSIQEVLILFVGCSAFLDTQVDPVRVNPVRMWLQHHLHVKLARTVYIHSLYMTVNLQTW
jgi:hypothetical protein